MLLHPTPPRSLDNSIIFSKICCCVKYWDYGSNNIVTECMGDRNQWCTNLSKGCSTHVTKMLLSKKLLLPFFIGLFSFFFFCWLPDGCAGRAMPSKMRHSLYTKLSNTQLTLGNVSFHSFVSNNLRQGGKVCWFFSYVLRSNGFSNKCMNPKVSNPVCLNESASWIHHVVNQGSSVQGS